MTAEREQSNELVIEIARELYDRFVMGGWEPQDAYPQIERWLALGVRQQREELQELAKPCRLQTSCTHGYEPDYCDCCLHERQKAWAKLLTELDGGVLSEESKRD
jgi:hypothetical protein